MSGMNDVVNKLAGHMMDDTKTVNDVFGEFKTEVRPERARTAAKIFSNEELDLLKQDYGSAIDTIKAKKR
jgi:hypothetical protein